MMNLPTTPKGTKMLHIRQFLGSMTHRGVFHIVNQHNIMMCLGWEVDSSDAKGRKQPCKLCFH